MTSPGDDRPGDAPEPPSDPEAWSDEQWLEWLRVTDGAGYGGPDADEGSDPGTKMTEFTRRPGARALGAAMLGLRNAMYGRPDDEIVIVADAGGDPPGPPERHELHLDPDHPERSEVVVHENPGDPADDPGASAG
ncbi:MAG TPA: hypothetical protein VMU09_05995 [Acidimicrobiales bacterium]|nr:hypothetical protein [Acidimicrobiales bacterium]